MNRDDNNIRIGILSNNSHSPWLKKLIRILGEIGDTVMCSESVLEDEPDEPCDLIMVDASGLQVELAECVARLHGRFPNTPIVVMTSSPTWRRARAVLQAGASDYMSRSIDDAMFLARCRSLLQSPP